MKVTEYYKELKLHFRVEDGPIVPVDPTVIGVHGFVAKLLVLTYRWDSSTRQWSGWDATAHGYDVKNSRLDCEHTWHFGDPSTPDWVVTARIVHYPKEA